MTLTLLSPPVSGLGDRFSAWLALFTVARFRGNETVLLSKDRWLGRAGNHTRSREANQESDIAIALDCISLPTQVLRHRPPHGHHHVTARLTELDHRRVFGPHVVLPRPTPGFPQWALPELASRAFSITGYAPNLTTTAYVAALRAVSAEITVRPSCVPPRTVASSTWMMPQGDSTTAAAAVTSASWDTGSTGEHEPAKRVSQLRVCLHLRRGDAWRDAAHSASYVHSINDGMRSAFTKATVAKVVEIVRLLDVLAANGSTSSAASWLIMSDNRTVADNFRKIIVNSSSTGQTAWVPPDGYTAWSFLVMRRASGIVQSTMRQWSSFSAVPAIMNGVPIYGVVPTKWGVLPHVTRCTVEQFVGGGEEAFVARMLGGPSTNCTLPPPRPRKEKRGGATALH
jgi:hypothetical protein